MRLKLFLLLLSAILFSSALVYAQDVVSPTDIINLEFTRTSDLSADGNSLIYGVFRSRSPNERPGGARSTYYLMNLESGDTRTLTDDSINLSAPQFSPDGENIAFLYRDGRGARSQVWMMSASGGDIKQLTRAQSNVTQFRWHPEGNAIAYLSLTPKTDKEIELEERGYDFVFYEENVKKANLCMVQFDDDFKEMAATQLTEEINVWDFEFDHQGKQIAYTASNENLIDQKYMFRRIYVHDLDAGTAKVVVKDRGKMGNYAFSPSGNKLAFTSAYNINDHAVSQALVIDLATSQLVNLTPRDFPGHMSWVAWKNDEDVVIYSDEGVYPNLSIVPAAGGEHEILLDAEETGVIFSPPLYNRKFDKMAFVGNTPYGAYNIYTWNEDAEFQKRTSLNEHLNGKTFGEQKVFQYPARDGVLIEGILIEPVNYKQGEKYPLILYVHGGPEAHHSNGWLSQYSTPGQVMAGKGYMVAYINYRASTGYGIDFGNVGFGDPAGVEFDDLADAIQYLTAEKGADADRVGMAGGSYGGYASAWFATYYTDLVNATCVFVGVTNLLSKKGTTDIPYEELLVHGKDPIEETWQFSLERSPVYYAHKSKTATLIYGGADDPRVHPTQSMELYRRMKMNDHPAVRLVQYPGEGHGNRKQVGRIDVIYRQINWLDWYVKENKPIDGPMPPLDISDQYGLDWEF